jgi:hypothetical protein
MRSAKMILRAPESSATPNKKAEAQKTLTYSNAVIGYCNRLADPVFGLTGFNHKLEFTDRQESYRLRTARIKVEVRGLI